MPRLRFVRPRNAHELIAVAAIVLLASCASADNEQQGTWQVERQTIGDTLVVRTVAGSVWGDSVIMREDLAIGVLEGRDELMFGSIQELAVDTSDGIYVFDGGAPALRYFDASGNYVRTLGGKGSGPGEYEDAALGLAVRSDGRIVLRDPRNSRLNVYEPDGTPSTQMPVASGLFTANAMVLDTADHVFLKILLSQPEKDRPWNIGFLHVDDQGRIVDSISIPAIEGEPTTAGGVFLPAKLWAWSPLGHMVVGVSNAVNGTYRVELRKPNGQVVRIERSASTVPVLPEERAERESVNDWYRKYQGRFMTAELPPVPTTKPPYRALLIGQDGRVWVQRHVTAERTGEGDAGTEQRAPRLSWREPSVYDVFEPDGTYLGEVRVPKGTSLMLVRGEQAWGTRTGEDGEVYVVRLRVEHDAVTAARE